MVRIVLFVLAWACLTSPLSAQGRWSEAARLDAPRAGLAVTVLDGQLYAAGGAGLTDPRVEFESFDAELNRWMPEQSLPRGLERFGLAAVDGRIYAAGGYAAASYAEGENGTVGPTALMWSWSVDGGVWQSEAAMPAPRADFRLIAFADRLYAIGGARDDQIAFVFDPQSTSWESLDVPAGVTRRAAATVSTGDVIYIIGGVLDGAPTARVDIFDPASGEWRTGAELPEPRSGLAAAFYNGRIHVFGGRGADQRTTLSDHASLAPGDARWRGEQDILSPRTAAAAAVLPDGIYLVGGGSGGGFFAPFTALDATDVFQDEGS